MLGLWFLVDTENDLFPISIKPIYSSLSYRYHGFILSLFSKTQWRLDNPQAIIYRSYINDKTWGHGHHCLSQVETIVMRCCSMAWQLAHKKGSWTVTKLPQFPGYWFSPQLNAFRMDGACLHYWDVYFSSPVWQKRHQQSVLEHQMPSCSACSRVTQRQHQ